MPRLSQWLWLGLLICLAGHLWLNAVLGLSVDEAHYALYAAHPALSYFDHPPLVGWMQIPFVFLGGADWMMRIVPLALWSVTACLLWRFSVFALVLFLLSPIHQLLGLALVPDTLLLLLTLWVMILTWRLSSDLASLRLWLWLGLALGLAGLSKYTGVFLALGTAIVLLNTHGLTVLKSRGMWLAILLAAVLVSPVIIWNALHGWVSFTYQFAHADGHQNTWQAWRVLAYSVIQLLVYGTLPLFGIVVFCFKLRHQHRSLMILCFAFGLPPLILTLYLSGKGSALPHWTASAWLALLPLSGLGLQQLWQSRQWLILGLGSLQILSILSLALAMAMGGQWQGKPLMDAASNPFADLYDWQAAAKEARKLQIEYHAETLAVNNWTLASRLAWYAKPSRVIALDGKNKQFEMWFGAVSATDQFIWVNWSQMPFQPPKDCSKLASKVGAHSQFDFYLCRP